MACALFGKLPAKRDFLTVNLSGDALLTWERWLQTGLAASKNALGPDWLAHYLHAPLWRFWLGEALCGQAITGVFMPSQDGVGRHFPLSVLALAPEGQTLALPVEGAAQDWHEQAEDVLLGALDHLEDAAPVLEALAALGDPPLIAAPAAPAFAELTGFLAATGEAQEGEENLALPLGALEAELARRAHAEFSLFWTIGGENMPPRALAGRGLPRPELFTEFLRGAILAPVDP